MADKKFPSFWIETGNDGKICVVMSGTYGPEIHLPFAAPAEDLVAEALMLPSMLQEIDPLSFSEVGSLLDQALKTVQLRLVELMMYFRQEKQRITRCDYCWNYFIPGTRAATLYCDRIFDGQSCKKRGANLKRRKGPERDDALKLFKQLRDRMYSRILRYQDAPENQRDRLNPYDGGTVR